VRSTLRAEWQAEPAGGGAESSAGRWWPAMGRMLAGTGRLVVGADSGPGGTRVSSGQHRSRLDGGGPAARRVGRHGRRRRRGEQRWWQRNKKTKLKCRGHCAARGVREVSMLVLIFYKRRLPRYICRLTDECMGLCSSIENILLGSSTEEYIAVIFLFPR
jgi:hypothetical protein